LEDVILSKYKPLQDGSQLFAAKKLPFHDASVT